MKVTPLLTDFTAGELSDKYASRVDDPIYKKGVRTFENMRPMPQGGFRSTGGSWYMGSLPTGNYRLIPFVISEAVQFLVCLGTADMRIYPVNADGSFGTMQTVSYGATYSATQIFEVQFCQNYNQMFITHQVHTPKILTYTGGSFTFSNLPVSTNADEGLPFQNPDEYPGSCAFFNGRLFLAGTISKPQGLWASVPFPEWGADSGNFLWFETIEVTTTQLKDSATWLNPEEPETEEVTTVKTVIGDGNALRFEIASDQNDSIVWMATAAEMLVGTITSEWKIPKTITANDIEANLETRFGTSRIQAKMIEGKVVMVQRGGKKIREYSGEDSKELSFPADHITGTGVKQYDATKTPLSEVYFVRKDGQIAVLLYDNSEEIIGWYRIKADFEYLSLAVVSSETTDFIYTVVTDGVTSWIERMDEDCLTRKTQEVTFSGGNAAVSNMAGVVQIWDSSQIGEATVSGGSVTLPGVPNGSHYVGNGFNSVLQTMSIEAQGESGTGQLKTKSASNVYMQVNKGGNFQVGYTSDPDHLVTIEDTGLVTTDFHGWYEKDLSLMVKRDKAYPLEVTVIIPEIEVNEI